MTCGPLRSKGIEMAYWRGGIFPLFGDKGGWVLQASQKNIGNGDYTGRLLEQSKHHDSFWD